jgi:hypothetical protein
MGFFWEIYVFLQLSWIGLFGAKTAYHHLEAPKLRKHYFQILTQFSQGKSVLELLLLIQMIFYREIHLFLQLSWIGLFWAKTAYHHLETPKLQKYSFQKLTKYSQGNNVLHASDSNTHGFLQEIHIFCPLRWAGLFSTKWAFLHFKNSDLLEVFLSKIIQFSHGNNLLNDPTSNTHGFLQEIHVFYPLSWIGLHGRK